MNQSVKDSIQSNGDYPLEKVIDLQEYWYIIRKNLFGVLGFAFVASSIAILVVFSMKPTYLGTTTLLIESNEANVVSIEEVYQLGVGKSEYYATQFEILKSRGLAEKVVEQHREVYSNYLKSKNDGGWFGVFFDFIYPDKQGQGDTLVADFMENLAVTPIRGTQLVKIGFESTDPQIAATMANDLARVYIDNNLESRLEMTKQASTWLAEKIDGLREKLLEAEQKLQAYRESEDLVDIEGVRTLSAKELEDTATKLAEARRQRTEAENIASQVDTLRNRNIETLSTIPAVLKHSLVQRFKEQEGNAEQKLAELSKRYGSKHPKIIAAKSDLDVARQNSADQILKVVEGIHKEYEVARATEDALAQQTSILKTKVQTINRKEYRLDELTREVAVNRQLYDTFFSRIKETSGAGDMQTANARVVDPAVVPTVPIKPKRVLLSVAAVVLSLIMGVCLASFREAFDSTIRSRDDVLLKLHLQLLGVLPLLKDKQKAEKVCLEFSKSGASTFSESIRTIRTGVVLSGLDNPHKILVVTSSIPSEGKTTVSANLAAAFGQMGRTLLIDADMRRPAIATNFGIKLSSPGLSNLVAETAEPKECIHRIEGLGIDVIPAGMVPPNPLELLSSRRFAAVLAGLEKHYDRIIIDSAPCEVVSDALILATFASAVIYVVKADDTNIKVVKSGISRLREAKAPLTGVVLNQVNIEKHSKYGYSYSQYYGGYYDYYGYSSSSSEKNST